MDCAAARYRAAKRAQGLRLKQIWAPDMSNPEVRERIRRESAEINRCDRESGIMAEIEMLADDAKSALSPYDGNEDPRT